MYGRSHRGRIRRGKGVVHVVFTACMRFLRMRGEMLNWGHRGYEFLRLPKRFVMHTGEGDGLQIVFCNRKDH